MSMRAKYVGIDTAKLFLKKEIYLWYLLEVFIYILSTLLILIDVDECGSAPCQNGGSCTDKINHYQCVCAAGYTGGNCEISRYS